METSSAKSKEVPLEMEFDQDLTSDTEVESKATDEEMRDRNPRRGA